MSGFVDSFYEVRDNPASRNVLAEYLLRHAPQLESLETNWAPIFSVKECLPRFACLSLYFSVPAYMMDPPEDPDDWTQGGDDSALRRNVRRLRPALRRHAESSRPAAASDSESALPPSITADDIAALGQRDPFERDPTWSKWLSDRRLLNETARAFNQCRWALHPDIAPHPAERPSGPDVLREDWPLPPYQRKHYP